MLKIYKDILRFSQVNLQNIADDDDRSRRLAEMMNTLSDEQKLIVNMYYGIGIERSYTLAEIAKHTLKSEMAVNKTLIKFLYSIIPCETLQR